MFADWKGVPCRIAPNGSFPTLRNTTGASDELLLLIRYDFKQYLVRHHNAWNVALINQRNTYANGSIYFLYSWLVALFHPMSSMSLVMTTTTRIPFFLEPFLGLFWDSIADSMAHACRFSTQINLINKFSFPLIIQKYVYLIEFIIPMI